MSAFVDFAKLKQDVSIEQVVQMLALQMKQTGDQWRGPCPTCKSGGDRALAINTTKQSFYCFGQKKGGDLIALTAHIKDISQRDAGLLIASHFGTVHSDTVTVNSSRNSSPQPQARKAAAARQEPLQPLSYLEA